MAITSESKQAGTFMGREDTVNWEKLFNVILNKKEIPNADYKLAVTEQEIKFITSNPKLADWIELVFQSPTHILQNLDYTLQGKKMVSVDPAEMPKLSTEQIRALQELLLNPDKIMPNLFSSKVMMGLNFSEGEFDVKTKSLSWTISEPVEVYRQLWELRFKMMKLNLSWGTLERVRDTLATENSVLDPSQLSDEKQIARHFDKLFAIKRDLGGTWKAYFHSDLLMQYLLPPALEEQHVAPISRMSSEGISYCFSLPKAHCLTYLSGVFQQGFAINQDTNELIALPSQQAMKPPNRYTVVLDVSSSMNHGGKFETYREQASVFLENICQKAGDSDVLHIVPFSSEGNCKTLPQEFMCNQKDLNSKVNAYLGTLRAQGCTYLNGTILKELKVQKTKPGFDDVFVIFTDGADTDSTNAEKIALKEELDKLGIQENPLKMYTLGLGQDYDSKLFQDYANKTGCEHIRLGKIEDFAKINAHIDKMQLPRIIRRIMQEALEKQLVVYQNSLAATPIDPERPFTVDGVEYTVQPAFASLPATKEAKGVLNLIALHEQKIAQQTEPRRPLLSAFQATVPKPSGPVPSSDEELQPRKSPQSTPQLSLS